MKKRCKPPSMDAPLVYPCDEKGPPYGRHPGASLYAEGRRVCISVGYEGHVALDVERAESMATEMLRIADHLRKKHRIQRKAT